MRAPTSCPRSLKQQLIDAKIIPDVIYTVNPQCGLTVETTIGGLPFSVSALPGGGPFVIGCVERSAPCKLLQLAGGALPFSLSKVAGWPPAHLPGAQFIALGGGSCPAALMPEPLAPQSGGRFYFLSPLFAQPHTCLAPTHLPTQNGQLLTETQVADAPTLAIKGAKFLERFVLFVVDPDAPDPVRHRGVLALDSGQCCAVCDADQTASLCVHAWLDAPCQSCALPPARPKCVLALPAPSHVY